MRPFQWYLRSHWKFPQSLDKRIPVTGNFLNHLKWWENLQNLMAGAPIHPHIHNTLIFTDASQKRLGSSLKQNSSQWPQVKQGGSASHQCIGAKSCSPSPKGVSGALARSKSAHLFRQQYSSILSEQRRRHTFHRMCALIWRILAFTNSRRIQIRARHVPGSLNVIADSLPRRDKVIQT